MNTIVYHAECIQFFPEARCHAVTVSDGPSVYYLCSQEIAMHHTGPALIPGHI